MYVFHSLKPITVVSHKILKSCWFRLLSHYLCKMLYKTCWTWFGSYNSRQHFRSPQQLMTGIVGWNHPSAFSKHAVNQYRFWINVWKTTSLCSSKNIMYLCVFLFIQMVLNTSHTFKYYPIFSSFYKFDWFQTISKVSCLSKILQSLANSKLCLTGG